MQTNDSVGNTYTRFLITHLQDPLNPTHLKCLRADLGIPPTRLLQPQARRRKREAKRSNGRAVGREANPGPAIAPDVAFSTIPSDRLFKQFHLLESASRLSVGVPVDGPCSMLSKPTEYLTSQCNTTGHRSFYPTGYPTGNPTGR